MINFTGEYGKLEAFLYGNFARGIKGNWRQFEKATEHPLGVSLGAAHIAAPLDVA